MAPPLKLSDLGVLVQDGWVNQRAGLGGSSDKGRGWRFAGRTIDPTLQLDLFAAAYTQDDVTAAIADRTPEAMFARGVDVVRDAEDDLPLVQAPRVPEVERELHALRSRPGGDEPISVYEAIWQVTIWDRLFGGGGVVLGLDDGRAPDQPLCVPAIRSLDWIEVLDSRQLCRSPVSPDLWNAHFVKGSVAVHRSRILLSTGERPPFWEARHRRGWGLGVIERAWDEIAGFHATWIAFRHLVTEGSVAVWKLFGLIEHLAERGEEDVIARIRLADFARSAANSVLIDAEREEYRRDPAPLSGWSEAQTRAFERLAMAIGIPVKVLVGIAPAGLQATGDADIRLWYDRVADQRDRRPAPLVLRAARLLAHLIGTPAKFLALRWPTMWRLRAGEETEQRQRETAADQAELDVLKDAQAAGYLSEEEAVNAWRAARGLPERVDQDPAAPLNPAGAPAQPPPTSTAPGAFGGHVGEVGRRVEWDARVISARVVGEDWSTELPKVEYLFEVPGGLVEWIALGERAAIAVGQQVRLRANVVEHATRNGRAVTVVNRVAVRGEREPAPIVESEAAL